jgi:hypothetical protein
MMTFVFLLIKCKISKSVFLRCVEKKLYIVPCKMNRDLIFFHKSSCNYSSSVIAKIKSNVNVESQFLTVDVEKGYKIPQFVDRLPMIFIKSSKEIVVDESIENLVDMILNRYSPKLPQQQQPPLPTTASDDAGDISSASDHIKGMSDMFSFIDGDGQIFEQNDMTSARYQDLSIPHSFDAPPPPEQDNDSIKLNKTQFDSFVSKRDSDLANLFPRKNVI